MIATAEAATKATIQLDDRLGRLTSSFSQGSLSASDPTKVSAMSLSASPRSQRHPSAPDRYG